MLLYHGITAITDEVALLLGQHEGALFLGGVTAITEAAAKGLARNGGKLQLGGLKTLSPEVAAALATHDHELSLSGLTAWSDAAAQAIAEHHSVLHLPKELDEIVRQAQDAKKKAMRIAEEEHAEAEEIAEAAAAEQRRRFSMPAWDDYEDLGELLGPFDEAEESPLDEFVRYGTPELAKKATLGDRFDREEAADASAGHRARLGSRKFWLQCSYLWDQREPNGGKENVVRLRVPLGFRCSAPVHGPKLGVAAYNDGLFWFLDKDGKLRRCRDLQDAQAVEENDGLLYVPETSGHCELVLWVDGPREVQKALARHPDRYVVNVGISGLKAECPRTEGFYKWKSVRRNDYTSGSLLMAYQNGLNGPEAQPNYFVTKVLGGTEDRSMPSFVAADVERVEVVNVEGEERRAVFTWMRK